MNFDIKYSKHFDLVFHVLAYLKVTNASNVYNKEYIDKIAIEKQNFVYNIIPNITALQQYYNNNFERLMLINFLPFCSNNFEDMKNKFITNNCFTSQDLKYFINPFVEILNNEAVFFFAYWDKIHSHNEKLRHSIEEKLKCEFEKYSCIFDYYNKSALAFLSYSITCNGRGFNGIKSYFSALAPFPKNNDYTKYIFFDLLHEYTHQFTDYLLKTNINMCDNSHNISENIVKLADYYLIKLIDKNNIHEYLNWLAQNSGYENVEISESEFLDTFKVDKEIDDNLKKVIDRIAQSSIHLIN